MARGTDSRLRRASALAVIAALAGCSSQVQTLTPEVEASMMANLQAGRQTLTCTFNCLLTWTTQASSIHGLDLAEQWPDLTYRVMQIGFGGDLAYYYLGQAAQGLGYHRAAINYYQYSLALALGSNSLLKCTAGQNATNDPCQGVDLVHAEPQLIAASQAVLTQQAAAEAEADAPTPVHHHHHRTAGFVTPPTATPAAPAATSASDGGFATPPPAQ